MGSKVAQQRLSHSLDATTNSPPLQSGQGRAPAFEFLFPGGEFDLVERGITILPAGWRTQVLVDNFFNRAHWQHRVSWPRAKLAADRLSADWCQLVSDRPSTG